MKGAFEATRWTIESRARLYRNVAVAVTATIGGSVGASLALWSPRPLAALAALVPICGGFLLLDGRLVQGWLRTVLTSWRDDEFRLSDFKELLQAHRYIPQRSLIGMLGLLPDEGSCQNAPGGGIEGVMHEAGLQQRRTLRGAAIASLLVGIPVYASVMGPFPLVLCLTGTLAVLAGLASCRFSRPRLPE